jgi:hypothetical protein
MARLFAVPGLCHLPRCPPVPDGIHRMPPRAAACVLAARAAAALSAARGVILSRRSAPILCSDVPSAALRFRPSSLVPHQLPLAPYGVSCRSGLKTASPAWYKSPSSPRSEQALDRRLTRLGRDGAKWQGSTFLDVTVEISRPDEFWPTFHLYFVPIGEQI